MKSIHPRHLPRLRRAGRLLALGLLIALVGRPAAAGEVPAPEAHLGFRPGADNHLAGWSQVVDYFKKVDEASSRVLVQTLGESTEGRPLLMAIVSGEEAIRDLG